MLIFNKKHPDFKGVRFVSKAVSKDRRRPALGVIHVTPDHVEATDGHRAHRYVPEQPVPPGFYTVVKATKSRIWLIPAKGYDYEYPSIDRVIPEPVASREFVLDDFEARYAQVIRAMPTNALNVDYFSDMLIGDFESFCPGDGCGPVLFEGPGYAAVIMPFRTEPR